MREQVAAMGLPTFAGPNPTRIRAPSKSSRWRSAGETSRSTTASTPSRRQRPQELPGIPGEHEQIVITDADDVLGQKDSQQVVHFAIARQHLRSTGFAADPLGGRLKRRQVSTIAPISASLTNKILRGDACRRGSHRQPPRSRRQSVNSQHRGIPTSSSSVRLDFRSSVVEFANSLDQVRVE